MPNPEGASPPPQETEIKKNPSPIEWIEEQTRLLKLALNGINRPGCEKKELHEARKKVEIAERLYVAFLERGLEKPLLNSTKAALYLVIGGLQITSRNSENIMEIDGLKFLQLVQAVAAEQK